MNRPAKHSPGRETRGPARCWRCGGQLRVYAGGEYTQCARCHQVEWRPRLRDEDGAAGEPKRDAPASETPRGRCG